MFTSLMFVSRSCLAGSGQTCELNDIVEQSRTRNAGLKVRGALVFTEKHFAQVLEGPKSGLDELMASICRDPRHQNVTVTGEAVIDEYRFPNWTLAYHGCASFIDQQVAALFPPRDATSYRDDAARLYFLVRSFAVQSQDNGPLGRPSPR